MAEELRRSAWARATARLARRDLAPRRWWFPAPAEANARDEDDALRAQRDAAAANVRRATLALAAFAAFCLVTLGAPDVEFLTGASRIRLPIADTDVDSTTFLTLAPLILIAQAAYLQAFLGQWLRLAPAPPGPDVPSLFDLATRIPAWVSYFAYYWLAPATAVAFAAKAAPTPFGAKLLLVTIAFTAVLVLVQLRRNTLGHLAWGRPLLWACVVLLACAGGRIGSWRVLGGPRPFARPWNLEGASLKSANLAGADLPAARLRRAKLGKANLRRADLHGADLADADLDGAELEAADLRGADLSGAQLASANLLGANLRRASARGTDFRAATIEPAQLVGVCFDSTTRFSAAQRPPALAAHCTGGHENRPWQVCVRDPAPPPCDLALLPRIVAPVGGYERSCLHACDAYYTDRGVDHMLLAIPDALKGGAWIQTENTGDKYETRSDFLRFELSAAARVFVAYDSRAEQIPEWLAAFRRTDLALEISEPDPAQKFVLYERDFARGTVTLGGNWAERRHLGRRASSNYLVIATRIAR